MRLSGVSQSQVSKLYKGEECGFRANDAHPFRLIDAHLFWGSGARFGPPPAEHAPFMI
jgi:hypothetical protein